jgi:hypothetical protein
MFSNNLILFYQTYYITKTESDSVAIIFVEQMLSMQKEGAAHRNTRDIAVRCTFMGSFNSQSTNLATEGFADILINYYPGNGCPPINFQTITLSIKIRKIQNSAPSVAAFLSCGAGSGLLLLVTVGSSLRGDAAPSNRAKIMMAISVGTQATPHITGPTGAIHKPAAKPASTKTSRKLQKLFHGPVESII